MQGTPRRTRGFKKLGEHAIGKSRDGWNTKLHVVSADDKVIVEMHLSGGDKHDAPEGRISIATVGKYFEGIRHVNKCIASGKRQSNILPLEKSLQTVSLMDDLRKDWECPKRWKN